MFEKKEAIVNGRKSFYWQNQNSRKPIVVLLHGFPGSHKGLLEVANLIGDYQIIIPDLPACGLSDSLSEEHTLKNYSKWLDSFLKQLFIDEVIVIGHSFGSRVALTFNADYPEKVKGLVLITPTVKCVGFAMRLVYLEYAIAKFLPKSWRKPWLFNKIHRKIEEKIIFKTSGFSKREELMDLENEELKRLDLKANIEIFNEFRETNLIPIGQKIKVNSLLIAGEKDVIAPVALVKQLVDQIASVEFVNMKGCGHIVVLENPVDVANIIRPWLEKF